MNVSRLMGRFSAAAVVVFASLVMGASSPASSGDEVKPPSLLQPGDLAVTGFSGTVLATDKLPLGVDPLDRTFIDPNGPALRIFDASSLSGTPAGQLVNTPPRLDVPAKDIGQVFALAIDPSDNGGPPRIFAAATSAFGLHIVGAGRAADGKPIRLKAGTPDASFMEGQFGSLSSNSPGAIYKIDGATGAVTYLADTAFSGILNSGSGIGGLAYDPKSRTLFASDLDSGLIHRFGLEYNAADLGQFDHGVTGRRANGMEVVSDDGSRLDITSNDFKADDPATWGFTQPARRVDALAVHDGRLYYSVAEGPEIWSVGLNGGAFLNDARREVAVEAEKPFPITAIAFDATGRMLLAQRGPVKNPYDYGSFADSGAQVLRYTLETPDDPNTPGLWSKEPATYAVGTADNSNAGSGGVSLQYGYRPDGFIDLNTCDGAVAVTGDTLSTTASGVQLNALELVRPANVPPAQSAFIGYDSRQGDPEVRGHVGSVAALRLCGVDAGFPPIAADAAPGEGGDAFPPVADGGAGGGGEAFPPVDDGGGGATTADGTAGETFPPVEDDGGGTTADETDPNAPNLAPVKTQTCKLVAADKAECDYLLNVTNTSQVPFVANEVILEDRFSVAPQSFDIGFSAAKTATGFTTEPNEFGATTIPPGPREFSNQIKATFAVPPGGLTVENCVTIKPGPGGEQARADFVSAKEQPALPDLAASTTKGLDRAVAITGAPQCTQRGNLRDCSWIVTISNPGTVPSDLFFSVTTSGTNPGLGSSGGIATNQEGNTTHFSTPGVLPPKGQKSFEVKGIFPAEPAGPITATATVASPNIADVNAANNVASAAAGTAAPQVVPSTGETSADSNPNDNTSCIKWDSTKPDDQGTPTTEPTLPPPVEPEEPTPSQAGQLSLLKTGVACKNNRICEFSFAIKNTSNAEFDGEVEFDDSITGDGAIFGATAIAPAPAAPWSCPKNGQGFKCTAKLKIPANGAAPPLNLTFDLGPGIGAVQNVENCATLKDAPAKSCATLPMNAPEPKPGQQGQLEVAKEALVNSCSALGGGCLFKVTIKNPGPGDFNGDIEFDDDATFLDKKLKVGQNSSLPNGCKHDGQGSMHCKIPGPLKAGGPPLEFTFNLVPQETTDAGSIRNCVTLAGAANKTCAEIPLRKDKTPLLRATKKLESGDCRPECTFVISVRNVGEGEFNGTFVFFDEAMKVGGNKFTPFERLNAEVTAVSASTGVTCPKGVNPICNFTGKIEPNGTVGATFKMVVIDKQFHGLNCGSVSGNSVDNTQNRERCVEISRDAKTEKPFANLSIEKRNASPTQKGADHCELKKECLFIIRVTNTGTGDFTGPIKVTDTISLGVPEVIEEGPGGNIGWKCSTAKNGKGGIATNQSIDCEIPGAPNPLKAGTFGPLAPGKFIELGISVKPGSTWQNSNSINNCAELVPLGADLGPLTGDKKKCASQRLDPFKVKVVKTGDQSCQPGGECRFELDIFNDEQIVHDDPVTVSDRLSGLSSAQIVSITPQAGADPFPCTPAPTQIPFTCTGHMNLTPGEHNKYVMMVRLPADATAASFSNCASVGEGQSSEGASEPACHSVQLAPPDQPFSLKIEKTGPASCKPGAECAFDLTLSNAGAKDHAGAVTLTDGLSGIDSMSILSISPPLPCTQQPAEIPFNCRTGDDFTLSAGGKRTFHVTARMPRSAGDFTNCAILTGGKREATAPRGADAANNTSSSCHNVKVTESKTEEPARKCSGGMIRVGEDACACPPGTEWNGRNCTTAQPPPPPIQNNAGGGGTTVPVNVCPRSRPVGTFPNCCERNTHFDRRVNPPRGACVPDKRDQGDGGSNTSKGDDGKATEKVCKPPRPVGTWPRCCPTDTHFVRGACRPDKSPDGDGGANTSKGDDGKATEKVCKPPRPVGTWPRCCPTDTHFARGACRPDKSPDGTNPSKSDTDGPRCPAGTFGRPPNCKCPVGMTGSPPNCCPPGTRFQNGKCVKPQPKERCTGGRIGTPPNCKCPPGTHWTRSEQCLPDPPPKQTDPPKTDTSKGKCTGGRIGTPPNCFCRPPAKFIGHRCRIISSPSKKGDEIIVK